MQPLPLTRNCPIHEQNLVALAFIFRELEAPALGIPVFLLLVWGANICNHAYFLNFLPDPFPKLHQNLKYFEFFVQFSIQCHPTLLWVPLCLPLQLPLNMQTCSDPTKRSHYPTRRRCCQWSLALFIFFLASGTNTANCGSLHSGMKWGMLSYFPVNAFLAEIRS